MSYTLYDTSITPAKQALTALASIIRKGEEHSNGKNLLTATLYDDMKPLSFQIVFAVSLAELSDPEVYREEVWTFPDGAERPMHFFELDGDTVWGATARMLRELLDVVLIGS